MNSKPLDTPGSAWLPPTRRVFFLGVFADEKKPSGSACIDASRLIFQPMLADCIQAVKPSELTERTLNLQELPDISILMPRILRVPYFLY